MKSIPSSGKDKNAGPTAGIAERTGCGQGRGPRGPGHTEPGRLYRKAFRFSTKRGGQPSQQRRERIWFSFGRIPGAVDREHSPGRRGEPGRQLGGYSRSPGERTVGPSLPQKCAERCRESPEEPSLTTRLPSDWTRNPSLIPPSPRCYSLFQRHLSLSQTHPRPSAL